MKKGSNLWFQSAAQAFPNIGMTCWGEEQNSARGRELLPPTFGLLPRVGWGSLSDVGVCRQVRSKWRQPDDPAPLEGDRWSLVN